MRGVMLKKNEWKYDWEINNRLTDWSVSLSVREIEPEIQRKPKWGLQTNMLRWTRQITGRSVR